MTLYLKYRSQTLDELIGQTQAKNSLKSAFDKGKLSHAYLFCGPRGTGKTSTARILAKMVNCTAKENIPCNKCVSCLSITNGTNMDVIEMDAASNTGVEDIRNLKDTIKLAPSNARKKVYIIDEVHMLSGSAFNAFLKTLEEPPSHVLFILATTEVQKIPTTILSRVTRIDFKPATVTELLELIKRSAVAEKIEIEEEAALTLARKASGSFRDAIKFLDQLASFGKIDNKVVLEGLGSGDANSSLDLLQSVAEKNVSEVLEKLNHQLELGVNIKELTMSLLDNLRQIMYIKNGLGERLVSPEVGENKYQQLTSLAKGFNADQIVSVLNNLQNSLEQARFVSIPSLPLEIALVESCGLASQGLALKGCDKKSDDRKSKMEDSDLKIEDQKIDRSNLSSTVNPQETIVHNPSSIVENSSSPDLQKISEKWTYILETVRAYNYSLEALLRSSKILECSEGSVIIEVPYSFHQRILESAKSRDLLESVFSDVLDRKIKIATALGKRPMRQEELSNIEVAEDDEIVKIASEIFNSETIN